MKENDRGMKALAAKLTNIQLQRMSTTLPRLEAQLSARLKEQLSERDKLGIELADQQACEKVYHRLVSNFCRQLADLTEGRAHLLASQKDLNVLYEKFEAFSKNVNDALPSKFLRSSARGFPVPVVHFF
eukprot:TRINITY_DN15477_c0_g1_i1.p1 TRINITY_DN15477_c0_g1~~TRINITY_DN15477_c0_g1_i1.p1  ORF type:complete len:129 (+),score=33.01 TRINITY_DN15477_c0_g1_i1:298-684(+)